MFVVATPAAACPLHVGVALMSCLSGACTTCEVMSGPYEVVCVVGGSPNPRVPLHCLAGLCGRPDSDFEAEMAPGRLAGLGGQPDPEAVSWGLPGCVVMALEPPDFEVVPLCVTCPAPLVALPGDFPKF